MSETRLYRESVKLYRFSSIKNIGIRPTRHLNLCHLQGSDHRSVVFRRKGTLFSREVSTGSLKCEFNPKFVRNVVELKKFGVRHRLQEDGTFFSTYPPPHSTVAEDLLKEGVIFIESLANEMKMACLSFLLINCAYHEHENSDNVRTSSSNIPGVGRWTQVDALR